MQYSRPETDLSAKTFAVAIGSKKGLRAKHPDQGVDRMDSENKRIYKDIAGCRTRTKKNRNAKNAFVQKNTVPRWIAGLGCCWSAQPIRSARDEAGV